MKLKNYIRVILITLLFANLGCGGGGGGSSDLDFSGVWDVSVRLAANSCDNSVPILETLTYEHTINENPDHNQINAVTIVDDNGDNFFSGTDTKVVTDDSFIVTGDTHPLNPFINGFSCTEAIVWGYFDIKKDGLDTFTNNVSRFSNIDCVNARQETVSCGVSYLGNAVRRF